MPTKYERTDKNHPSIIIWCVANEPGVGPYGEKEARDVADSYFREICEHVHALDTTRPITIASCKDYDNPILKYCDIVSKNKYCGWYSSPGQTTKDGGLHRAKDVEEQK